MLLKKKSRKKVVRPNRRKNGVSPKKRTTGDPKTRKNVRKEPKKSVTGGHTPHYGHRKKKSSGEPPLSLPSITPWKVILTSFLIGICGFIYISHVFATQQLLEEVQQLEHEFNRVNRIHSEHRLEYDRMVGPREIYQRARQKGFVNAGPADRVITLD